MSSNTDFYAQMMNDNSDEGHHSDGGSKNKKSGAAALLALDLSLAPESPLANSIAQICQGVIGSLFAEGFDGGYRSDGQYKKDKVLKTDLNMDHNRITNVSLPNDYLDAANREYVDREVNRAIQEIKTLMLDHISACHTKPVYEEGSIEALREKVKAFNLFREEPNQ